MHGTFAFRGALVASLAVLFVAPVALRANFGDSSLAVLLATPRNLSAETRIAMIDEATRIWADAGVHLTWTAPSPQPPPARRTLRLLAVARPSAPEHRTVTVLGE